jgi:hypothetical protein
MCGSQRPVSVPTSDAWPSLNDISGSRRHDAGAGKWFIKFIHMTPLSEPNLKYESKWASLTFEIRH